MVAKSMTAAEAKRLQRDAAKIKEAALLELWQYAAEIQHRVPAGQAFELLFQRIDEKWLEATRAAK